MIYKCPVCGDDMIFYNGSSVCLNEMCGNRNPWSEKRIVSVDDISDVCQSLAKLKDADEN